MAFQPRPAPHEMNLLFLDTETGGLSAVDHDIVEIAVILTDPTGQTVIKEYCSKVVPEKPVDPVAARINGYSAEKWAHDAVPINQAMITVLGMARDTMMAAHNAPFDKAFVDAAISKHKMRWPGSYHSVDTVGLAMPLLREGLVPNIKLVTLTAFFNIPHQEAHSAMGDVRACREVYLNLMSMYRPGVLAYVANKKA